MKDKKVCIIVVLICLTICLLIAVTFKTRQFIRGFMGDIFATILIYYFFKIIIKITSLKLSILVLTFAFTVEILQYFQFVDLIGLGENRAARIIIGTTFDFRDLAAYTIGVLSAYIMDRKILFKKKI